MKRTRFFALFLAFVMTLCALSGCAAKAVKKVDGNCRSYEELSDGSFRCEGYSYRYRLEITGRLNNAVKDTTFVYLSNLEEISFERAWKAAGLSSDSNDYFSPEKAVLVDMG